MSVKHLALPDELLVAIFLELDVISISACQQTCKRFRRIIKDSVYVQYHVELQLAGMENVPTSDMSTTSRLSILRAQRRAWDALSWSTPEPVVLPTPPGVEKWKLAGGVLCLAGPDFVQCIRLASSIRGIEQREWRVDHTCGENYPSWNFCHDPSQDLLVLFEEFKPSGEEESDSTFKIHLLTLSTGAPHPAATSTVLLYAPSFWRWYLDLSLTVQICGRHVAMLIEDMDDKERPRFAAWDWLSGLMELETGGHFAYSFRSFSLLSGDLLLLGAAHDMDEEKQEAYLSIYDLAQAARSGPYTLKDEDDLPYICKLQLGSELACYSMLILSAPPPVGKLAARTSTEPTSPFIPAPEAQVIAVYVNVYSFPSPASALFFPISNIMEHVCVARTSGSLGLCIPWSDWGISSRVFMVSFAKHWMLNYGGMLRDDSACGLRFASFLDEYLLEDQIRRFGMYKTIVLKNFRMQVMQSSSDGVWTRILPRGVQATFRVAYQWDRILLGEDVLVFISRRYNEHTGNPPGFAVLTLKEPEDQSTGGARLSLEGGSVCDLLNDPQ